MFGKYFYNKNIRNVVVLFGTLFNNITIRRTLKDGTIQNTLKVPLAYGPAQKYLTRLEQGPVDEDKETIGMNLPRMSFEITTMTYDETRKLQSTKKIREVKLLGAIDSINITNGGSGYTTTPTVEIDPPPAGFGGATATATITDGVVTAITLTDVGSDYTSIPNVKITGGGGSGAKAVANVDSDTSTLVTAFTPVPYNFEIDLSIMVKNTDDGTQILEQILPYFTPEFQVTMNELKTMGIKRDIPIILNSMSTEDDYEGDFLTRKALIHTLSFTVQAHLYGPTSDQGIIREVDVNTGTFQAEIDTQLQNIDIKPDPLTAEPDDAPVDTTITITDL